MRVHAITVGLVIAALGCLASAGAAAADDLLIKNVTIVSPEREAPSAATNVLVRDGRIVAIGRELPQGIHGSDDVIDGTGRYLAPGLIDAHTHLSDIPGMSTLR